MIIPFNCDSVRLTSPYGNRVLNGINEFHPGYDLAGIGSIDVVAVEGGKVVQSRIVTDKTNRTWQWGNYICIKTDSGQYQYYCHLSIRYAKYGQTVKAGDIIGVMGNTGYSFGAHLHFEVRQPDGKTTVCPETVLGISNAEGIYTLKQDSQLDKDLDTLMQYNIISTKEYWINTSPTVKYLPDLIHNMSEYLRK